MGFHLVACSDDEDAGTVTLHFDHVVDGTPVSLNAGQYTNAAGDRYSVSRLEYILTDLSLVRTNGTTFRLADLHYVSADDEMTLSFNTAGVAGGDYRGITFRFGVAAGTAFGDLPASASLNNMEWPVPLGGGYHYMRLEGLLDGGTEPLLTHLGPSHGQDYSFTIESRFDLHIDGDRDIVIAVTMDLAQWWQSPHTYDFTGRGMIMGRPDAQGILQENGATVFRAQVEAGGDG